MFCSLVFPSSLVEGLAWNSSNLAYYRNSYEKGAWTKNKLKFPMKSFMSKHNWLTNNGFIYFGVKEQPYRLKTPFIH